MPLQQALYKVAAKFALKAGWSEATRKRQSGLAPSTRDEAAATGALQSCHKLCSQSGLERSDNN